MGPATVLPSLVQIRPGMWKPLFESADADALAGLLPAPCAIPDTVPWRWTGWSLDHACDGVTLRIIQPTRWPWLPSTPAPYRGLLLLDGEGVAVCACEGASLEETERRLLTLYARGMGRAP